MNQIGGGSDWIDAFLEWTEIESAISGQSWAASRREAFDGGADETASVYLEWIDAAPAAAPRAAEHVLAPEPLHEAILLMALRTESECMHMLRQALDEGQATPQKLRLAMEALECAKALITDERRAWDALSALRLEDQPLAWISWTDDSQLDWPCALEDVEADVRALSRRIVELRAH